MNERIKELRKAMKLSQADFAEKLKVSRIAEQKWESGENNISEALIYRIVKEFGVDEVWLRTGEGEMFKERTRSDEIAAFIGEAMAADESDLRQRVISLLSRLRPEDWTVLEQIYERLANEK